MSVQKKKMPDLRWYRFNGRINGIEYVRANQLPVNMDEELQEFVTKNELKIDFDRYFVKISKDHFVCLLCRAVDLTPSQEKNSILSFEKDFIRHYKFQCPGQMICCMGSPDCKVNDKRSIIRQHEK